MKRKRRKSHRICQIKTLQTFSLANLELYQADLSFFVIFVLNPHHVR